MSTEQTRTVTGRQQAALMEQLRHYKTIDGDAVAGLRAATDADWARADDIAKMVGRPVVVATRRSGTVQGELLAATALGVWIRHPLAAHIRLADVLWVAPVSADGGPHDDVHAAVKALLARRPYTAETDALVTLLRRLCDRHQVPAWPGPDRRCSCGAHVPDFADEPCPEMEPVIELAGAIVEDDRRELVLGCGDAVRSEQSGETRG